MDKHSEPALDRSSDVQSTDQRLTCNAGVVLGYGGGRDLLFFRKGRLIRNGHSSQRLDVTARAFPLPLGALLVAASTAEKRVLGVGGNRALMAGFR